MKAYFYVIALLVITRCMAQQTFDSLMAPESVVAYKALTEKLVGQADSIFPYETKTTVTYKAVYVSKRPFSEYAVSGASVYYDSRVTVKESKGIATLFIERKGKPPVKPATNITEQLILAEGSKVAVWLEDILYPGPLLADVKSFLQGQYMAISFRDLTYLGNQTSYGAWVTFLLERIDTK